MFPVGWFLGSDKAGNIEYRVLCVLAHPGPWINIHSPMIFD
jgi:hypothetical protein